VPDEMNPSLSTRIDSQRLVSRPVVRHGVPDLLGWDTPLALLFPSLVISLRVGWASCRCEVVAVVSP